LKSKECVIISGSPEFYGEEIDINAYWIVCDAGYRHCRALGREPDILMGDFDSYHGEITPGVPVFRAPAEKDDTDTMLAIRYALEHGMDDISLYGATGGRYDHFLANLQAAAYVAAHGGICKIFDKDCVFYVFKNRALHLKRRPGFFVSVFSHSDVSHGVTLRGLKYPLTDATVTNAFPIGVSNEFKDDEAAIIVREGMLIVLLCRE